jgi:hypothetical protein
MRGRCGELMLAVCIVDLARVAQPFVVGKVYGKEDGTRVTSKTKWWTLGGHAEVEVEFKGSEWILPLLSLVRYA